MLETNLVDLFDKAVSQYAERVAFKDKTRSITYKELNEEVNRMANVLKKQGINHLDRVAVWLKNGIDFIITDFALIKVGATRVCLNTFLSTEEVTYRINDSGAKLLICEEEYKNNILSVRDDIASEIQILTNGGSNSTNFKTLLTEASTNPIHVPVEESDLTLIMYTGGTTGRSKGVKHTHKSVIAIVYSEIVELEISRGVHMLHVAPLPHAAGFLIFPGLIRGGKQVIYEGFDPVTYCEAVEKEKITFSFLVPTMIYMILDLPNSNDYDLSSLKTIIYGAAPMAPSRIREAIQLFGNVLIQIYSQAEVANQTTVLTADDHLYALENDESILSSCGRSIIMSQVKIVDDKGEVCPPKKVGEIITKGPHLMEGYWKMEEETNHTIRDGWLYTGDIGYVDERGYMYLVDRKKDVIISGGFNVYTTVTEKVLFEHPSVLQATVIGVPDKLWGEAVKAFIVPREDSLDEESLLQYCKIKLSNYEVPKSIEIVSELPLTPYGKIDKKKLREPYWSNIERQVN
ncbi:class I adenylate-forming enzyme family protein [Oceanobacillus jeddahense]|uniref:class I adenylate-forming enzyme family protein n=1 Tax=Oceanobacillus jeddahense TaxID=1462527 RepID=UPI0005959108|nr:AMP-binding protein [Oceanobacillus jeddahense]